MMPVVPETVAVRERREHLEEFGVVLESLLAFLGAAAGWLALRDSSGRMTFALARGAFADDWLSWQHSPEGVWGIAADEGPMLLNELDRWTALGDPPLRNLLSCPLRQAGAIVGRVTLANKPQGFSTLDTHALQAVAHTLAALLHRPEASAWPAAWGRLLERIPEGILVLDESGLLVYANRTWLEWTDFDASELLGRRAPFPFWPEPRDLACALSEAESAPAGTVPFRRRDRSLFWCQVESETERWAGQSMTVAVLRQRLEETAIAIEPQGFPFGPLSHDEPSESPHAPGSYWLPLLVELGGGIEGWCPRWEELTGLSAADVEGGRTELVLDWLFPQQSDRERVSDCFQHADADGCQLLLDVVAPNGSRPLLCNFYPLPKAEPSVVQRWLLLIGEPEEAAAAGASSGASPDGPSQGPFPPPQREPPRLI